MAMAGSKKREHEDDTSEIVDESELDISTRFAAAKALPSVVGISSRNLPDDMAEYTVRSRTLRYPKKKIEAEGGELVDVYLWDGKVCNGKVVACDFHYNLAALKIETNYPLPIAAVKGLDNVVPIYYSSSEELQLKRFQLRHHSKLFKISPETKIVTLSRTCSPLNAHLVGCGVFGSTSCDAELDCNELCWVKDSNHPERDGGAVVNQTGEFIGLMFYDCPFLPINVVSRWWKHFKSCGQYHRPWLGVEVANLHSSCFDFLVEFMRKFPNVATGVVVTKVAVDSPAYYSGLRSKDVIVNCDGKLVRSTLEFFDLVWNRVRGEHVEVHVLRMTDGETVKLSLTVGEITPDKFYQWHRTFWKVFPKAN